MITQLLSDEALAYLKENAGRLEAETQAWIDGGVCGPCPTGEIERLLLAEMVNCLGVQLVRPMIECMAPEGGWPSARNEPEAAACSAA